VIPIEDLLGFEATRKLGHLETPHQGRS
jgi:hypothetical protein